MGPAVPPNSATILPAKPPSEPRLWAKTRQLQKPRSNVHLCFASSRRHRREMSIPAWGHQKGESQAACSLGSPPEVKGSPRVPASTSSPASHRNPRDALHASSVTRAVPCHPLHLFHLPYEYAAAVASLKQILNFPWTDGAMSTIFQCLTQAFCFP